MIDLRECKIYGDENFVVPDKPVNVCESTCYSDDKVHITVDWDDILNVPNNLATTEYVTEALAAVSTTWDGGVVNNETTFMGKVKFENSSLYLKTLDNRIIGIRLYDENENYDYLIARHLNANGGSDYAKLNTIYSRWRPDNPYNKFLIQVENDNNGYYTALECFYEPRFHQAKTTVRGDILFHKNLVVARDAQMYSRGQTNGEFDQNTDKMVWEFQDSLGFEFNYDLGLKIGKQFFAARDGRTKNPIFTVNESDITHHMTDYFEHPIYVNGYEVITAETINNYIQNGGGSTGSWDGGTVNLPTIFNNDVTFENRTTFNFGFLSVQNDTRISVHNKNDGSTSSGLLIGQWGINYYLPVWFYEPIYVNGYEVITTETINNYIQNGGGTGGENTGSWNGGTVTGVTTFTNEVTFNSNPYFNCPYVYMNSVQEVQIGTYDDYQAGVAWGIKMAKLYSNNMSCEYLHISQRGELDIVDQSNLTKAKFTEQRTDIYTPLYVNYAEVITTANIGNYVSGGTGGEGGGASVQDVVNTITNQANNWNSTQFFNQNPYCEGHENIHAGNIGNYTGNSLNIWKGTQTQFEEAQIDPTQYDFIFIIAE